MSCCNQSPPPFIPFGCTPCNASAPRDPRIKSEHCAECKIVVEAETLAPDAPATAEEKRLDCGSYVIFFGIPRGKDGAKGEPGAGLNIVGQGVYRFRAIDGKDVYCTLQKTEGGSYGWLFSETNPFEAGV